MYRALSSDVLTTAETEGRQRCVWTGLDSVADPALGGMGAAETNTASAAAACAKGSGHLRPGVSASTGRGGRGAHCQGQFSVEYLGPALFIQPIPLENLRPCRNLAGT